MKVCKRCGQDKPLADYYVHKMMGDGYLSFCKTCTKERIAAHRVINLDDIRMYDRKRSKLPHRQVLRTNVTRAWRHDHPEKKAAHSAVSKAIRHGLLVRLPCERCGSDYLIHGHHEDYSRPLDVTWLCAAHHKERHLELLALEEAA